MTYDNIILGFIQVIMVITWTSLFALVCWLLILWIELSSDYSSKKSSLSQFFPIFLFSDKSLSEDGIRKRVRLVKILKWVLLLMIFNASLLLLMHYVMEITPSQIWA